MEKEWEKKLNKRSKCFVLMTQSCCVNGSANAHLEPSCWTCCPQSTDRTTKRETDRRTDRKKGKQRYREQEEVTHIHIHIVKTPWPVYHHKLILTPAKISAFIGFAKAAEDDSFTACYWTVSVACPWHKMHAAASWTALAWIHYVWRIIKDIAHLYTVCSGCKFKICNNRSDKLSLFVHIIRTVSMDVPGPHQLQFLSQVNLSTSISIATLRTNRFLQIFFTIIIAKLQFCPFILSNKSIRKYQQSTGW